MTRGDGPIGIGLIGAGWWGERHATAIARAGGLRLVASCRENAQAIDGFAARHGGAGYRRIDDLLADPAIEAVVIATPHHLHEAHAVAALAAGKHVLLEKPMATSVAACDRIAAAARQAGTELALGHTMRFFAPLVAAKAVLDRGELGAVRFARGSMIKLWMEPNRRPWHHDPACGGGLLLTAGIHVVDAVLWLIGAPLRHVHGVIATGFHAMAADDIAQLTLRFDGGALASISSVGYTDGAPVIAFELVCERGTMIITPGSGVRIGQGGIWRDLSVVMPADVAEDALIEEWRAFARTVRQGAPPAVDALAGRRVIACLEAGFESARLSREVDLAP